MKYTVSLAAILAALVLPASSVQSATWFSKFDSLATKISHLNVRGVVNRPAYKAARDSVLPAPNCGTLECPPYKLVHEESDFQIRRYRNTTWIETESLQDVSFMKATYRGFKSLFDYIQGENLNATHVPMTAPVLTSIVPSAGPFCSSAFVVRLYLPSKFSDSPPVPKSSQDPKLRVTSSGHVCIAVRKFSGFATDFNVADEAASLAESLRNTPWAGAVDGENFGEGGRGYAVAQYNSPFEFAKRVNEIWVTIHVDEKGLEECRPAKPAPTPKASEAAMEAMDDEPAHAIF